MKINRPAAQINNPKSPSAQKPPEQSQGDDQNGSVIRDVAAFGAGAVAGVAGGIYGFGEGLVTNGIQNFPTHVKAGAEIGKAVATPVGGAVGAIATGTFVGLAAVATPVALVAGTVAGFLGQTVVSALKQTPASIVETGKKGAEAGGNLGAKLGSVGEVVGKYVGGALGGVAGIAVAAVKGVPAGFETGKDIAKTGFESIKDLPDLAKDSWGVLYPGGRTAGGFIGTVSGGASGLFTASAETVVEGTGNSVKRGGQWAKGASDYVSGSKE